MTMALGIGVGLPFGVSARRLPYQDQLLWWLDPRRITATPVDSWPARVGTFSPTASGGARPVWDGTSVDFDGTDDALTIAASAATNPDGATKFTLAWWANADSVAANAVVLETATAFNGLLVLSAPTYIDIFAGSAQVVRFPSAMTVGAWAFYALTVDLGRSTGSKCRLFRGEPTVAEVTPTSDNIAISSMPAASGTAVAGGRSTVFFDGKIGDAFLWSGVELSAAELQQVVNATNY